MKTSRFSDAQIMGILAPGERAEILVDFGDGNPATLTSPPDANSGMGGMMGRFQKFANMVGTPFEVLLSQQLMKTLHALTKIQMTCLVTCQNSIILMSL